MRRTALLVAIAMFLGCGGDGGASDGADAPADDASAESGTDGAAADGGDAVDEASETGDDTTPGSDAAEDALDAVTDAPDALTTTGHAAISTVAGGLVMSSTGYRLVMSVGQGPGGNVKMTSASYTLRTGLVGATQP